MISMDNNFISLEQAVKALKAGDLVLYPTETYYALGCDAFNSTALGKIYNAKKRPLGRPLPVIIASLDDLPKISTELCPTAQALIEIFWPGSLTIIFPAHKKLPDLLTAKTGFVAVRMSPHPVPSLLASKGSLVLTASSANISGSEPVVQAEEIDKELVGKSAGILNQGPKPKGMEASTIVKIHKGHKLVEITRKGAIKKETLEEHGFTLL